MRRGKKGSVLRIVEEKDASLREKEIQEVAVSIYTFQSAFLKYGLTKLSNKNAQGEYYLTDLISQAARAKKKVDVLGWNTPEDLRGVNDPWELAQASRILNERCLRDWALKGVKFTHPWTTWIDVSVELEEDVVICPGAILTGTTRIARGAQIGPRCVLKNVTVGKDAHLKTGTVAEDSTIGESANVGPYAHLRPGTVVGARAKIGNFVEIKKSKIGERTSIAHLSYVGDAEVGKDVNIGCGFVTCNFDGRVIEGERKHRTVIEDGVFLGSDCQAVAPVRIGRGAFVASGSTITEDVEADALAIARARQVNKTGLRQETSLRPGGWLGMCGIVGYIGTRPAVSILLQGLKRLEYRGYDSAGVAFVTENGHVEIRKSEGKLENVAKLLNRPRIATQVDLWHRPYALGDSRKADDTERASSSRGSRRAHPQRDHRKLPRAEKRDSITRS